MRNKILWLLATLFFASTLSFGQITSTTAYRIRFGAGNPASCTADLGMVFFNTTNDTLYLCTATDTWTALGGAGDVVGPGSATDNAIARFDSTTGKLLQNSGLLITDNDDLNLGGNILYGSVYDNGNSGAADTIDWGNGFIQKSTLTGNATFTFTDPPGPSFVTLMLIQDATGSRDPTWPAEVIWTANTEPRWSTAGSAVDVVTFFFDGTNYRASSASVIGPASATDDAIARFDGTTGKLVQNSGLRINDSSQLLFGGSAALPAFASADSPTSGILATTNTISISTLGNSTTSFNASGVSVGSGSAYAFGSTTAPTSTQDVKLTRDGAGIFALKNSTNAQEARIYITDGASDDEFLSIGALNYSNTFTIQSEQAGSGVRRPIQIFSATIDDGNSSTADTIDFTAGSTHKSTLTGDVTYTFTDPPGTTHVTLILLQDGSGSRNPSWPANVKWDSDTEPTWTTTAGDMDIVSCLYESTADQYYCAANVGFNP